MLLKSKDCVSGTNVGAFVMNESSSSLKKLYKGIYFHSWILLMNVLITGQIFFSLMYRKKIMFRKDFQEVPTKRELNPKILEVKE